MIIYSLLYTFLSILLLINKKYYLLIVFFILYIFSAIRFDVGVDFMAYYESLNNFKYGTSSFQFEPMNMLIINLINYFEFNYQIFLLIYSFLSLVGIYYFINKLSKYKKLSIFIFFTIGIYYFSTFNLLRQSVAVSLLLIGVVKLIEGKDKQFFVLLFFASSFHLSSIIGIVYYFFRIRLSIFNYLLIIIILGGLSELFLYLITFTKYVVYLEHLRFSEQPNPGIFLLFIIFSLFIPIFLGYFRKNKFLELKEVVLVNMNLFSLLIILIGYKMGIDFSMIMRLNIYFQYQLIILIPIVIYSFQNKYFRFILNYSLLVFCTYYYFSMLFINGMDYKLIPYKLFYEF